MSAGSCQAHSCGVAFRINDGQGHPSVASEERGGEGEEQQGGVAGSDRDTLLAGLSWAWSVLGHILENFPWKGGLPWLPHLVPPGLGKSQVLQSQWMVEVRNLDKRWSSRCLRAGPETLVVSMAQIPVFSRFLVLVFLQFPSPGRVL